MADSDCIVPYHDPYDDTVAYCESFFNFDDDNFSLDSIDDFNHPATSFTPQTCDDAAYVEDVVEPFDDPILWDFCFDPNLAETEMTPLIENSRVGEDIRLLGNVENQSMHSWQDRISPVDLQQPCRCCQVLREIIHTNGTHTTKLELHGTLGIICHAVLDNQRIQGADQFGIAYQMFDFGKNSIEDVKHFLEQYCEARRQGGYVMLQDALSIYYEALCAGYDWADDHSLIADDCFEQSPPNVVQPCSTECQTGHREKDNREERLYRTPLAAQRERTGRLKLSDMANFFHLPIEAAARRLNVCPTVVKKICRRNGLTRWPHRKIKSLKRQISIMRQALNGALDVREQARIEADINRIQVDIANLCGGLSVDDTRV